MCNYWANRLCCEAADRAMQVHGGIGYSRHKPFEHIYRHHRRYRITEGSEEIQMRKVAAFLFGYIGPRQGAVERDLGRRRLPSAAPRRACAIATKLTRLEPAHSRSRRAVKAMISKHVSLFGGSLALAGLLAAGCLRAGARQRQPPDRDGPGRGGRGAEDRGQMDAFRGIPYAAPPVGRRCVGSRRRRRFPGRAR